MEKLGKIERISDLRQVWKHEAQDFSKWLAEEENLSMLSQSVGIEILLEELESSVGNFSVDIFATEEGTGRKIIIENQLEETNHDHLGKIITYASGKSAEVVIWIVKRARDEHRQAVEWLNQHTDENIGFFLVEIELWKIDNSALAPKFNVVERPNDWSKNLKLKSSLTDTQKIRLEFWTAFNEFAFTGNKMEFSSIFRESTPQPQTWYNLRMGTNSYHISLAVTTQKKKIRAEIYIPDDKELYFKFKTQASGIAKILGKEAEWSEAKKACVISAVKDVDIKTNCECWNDCFDWFCETALKLKEVIEKFG